MKKIICLILCFSLILLSSCSKAENKNLSDKQTDNAAATTQNKTRTYTGYVPMEKLDMKVTDPKNSRGLPENKIAHSYGVAKKGEPHEISVNSQNFFAQKKYRAITFDTLSVDKRLYLTFDCGYENGNTSKILDVLKSKNVKAAFFCTVDELKSEPELIARMIKEGHIVGNHSATHPSFATISRTEMANEIEECENFLRQKFGYTSVFFRFPKGEYNESALELIGSLGYVSVFWSVAYSDWDTNNQKGADYAFEKVTSRLHPGAIILLHSVSKDNADALSGIIDYARNNGYIFCSLEELDLSFSE